MVLPCLPHGLPAQCALQHGRSHYQWLNDKLDDSAADHQRKWGCLWNRDILDIVKQVRGGGLCTPLYRRRTALAPGRGTGFRAPFLCTERLGP